MSYTAESISVLKGLEPVRHRPGMYTRTDHPLHIIQEAIDNAADEALGGYCKRIAVTLHSDGSVSVQDDGRGIPVEILPVGGVAAVQVVFTPAASPTRATALRRTASRVACTASASR